MSPRVRRHAERQNLDSLLDTMANVTGILVVLMAVTQISVGDAMDRLRGQLLERPELSREALVEAASEAESLREALAPRLGRRDELEADLRAGRGQLAALRQQIGGLENEVATLRAQPRSAAEAERRVAGLRGRTRDLEQALAREQAAAAALERELASLPSAPVARDARLPDSRRASPGAAAVIYAVRHGRLARLDARSLVETLESAVWHATRATDIRALESSALLRAQAVEYFAMRDVGNRDLRWRLFEEGDELVAHLEWRHEGLGETLLELGEAGSQFRAHMQGLDRTRTALQFLVWDDSFETYLAARKLSDRAGFAAGWEPFDTRAPLRHYVTHGRSRGVVID